MLARRATGGSLNADETCGRPVAVTRHSAGWFNNSGLLQPSVSDMGHLSATTIGLVTQWHSTVPMTECSMAGDKTRRAHAVEDIIGYF
jgi:hypothetical protein